VRRLLVTAIVVPSSPILTRAERRNTPEDGNLLKCNLFFLNAVDWIGLAQDRYRWRALVNSVMNLQVP
jgi:hypothetical protein